MKIAVSADSQDLNKEVAEFFGRCKYFIIAEIKDEKVLKSEAIENKSAEQASGAGMAAAQLLAEKNVEAVIARNVGPRAMDVLKQFNIKVDDSAGSVNECIEQFIKNK